MIRTVMNFLPSTIPVEASGLFIVIQHESRDIAFLVEVKKYAQFLARENYIIAYKQAVPV